MRYILYSIGSVCNMNCSYCFREEHSSKVPNFEELISDCKHFRVYLDSLSDCDEKIALSGGEPTLVKNLEKLYDVLISDNTKIIQLNSNMTANSDVYNSLYEYAKSKNLKFRLVGSLHEEFMSFEKYCEKTEQIKFNFFPQLVATETNEELVEMFKNRFPNAIISPMRKRGEPPSSVNNPDGLYVKTFGKDPHRRSD